MSHRFTPPSRAPRRANDSPSPFPHAPAPSKSIAHRSNQPSARSQARPPYPGRSWLAHLGIEANERLTGSTALALLILLAVEGVTIIRVHSLLTLHVFVGALLVPPVLVKISSTTWRFAKYYLGTPEYRHKGPPPIALRVLGPFSVILTVVVFATGFLALLGPVSTRGEFLQLHRASFIAWFAVMTIHVLGHLGDMTRLATKDWTRRARQLVAGAQARRVALVASLVVGLVLAIAVVSHVGPWLRGS